jgi:hypothetical protein
MTFVVCRSARELSLAWAEVVLAEHWIQTADL